MRWIIPMLICIALVGSVIAASTSEKLLKETEKYKLYGKEETKKYNAYRAEVKEGQSLNAIELMETIEEEQKKEK